MKKTSVAKLTTLDRQFLSLIQELEKDKQSLGTEELVEYGVERHIEWKRRSVKQLYKAAENALWWNKKYGEKDDTVDLDSDSVNELEEGVEYVELQPSNSMNSSLLAVYSKSVPTASQKEPAPIEHDLVAKPSTPLPLKRKKEKGEAAAKKPKTAETKWPAPKTRLQDLGGLDDVAQELLQLIGMPLLHPEIFMHLGIDPPRGILLQGAPGCGKTLLAHAIAGEAGVPFISIAAPTLVSGMSGESEKKIREIFDEARELAPCILFIDEIDAITPKRETAQREMERRIVAQLLTSMDDVSFEKTEGKAVIVIGATNRPDSLDPALRRAGRFDREITLPVPDEQARAMILEKMCSKLSVHGSISFQALAKLTPGFVGADLKGLMGEAGMIAVKRIFSTLVTQSKDEMAVDGPADQHLSYSAILESIPDTLTQQQLEPLSICFDDFVQAVKKVQPSSKREGFATIPGVSWDDIGALEHVREELRMAVVEPIKHPEYFKAVGLTSAMGVLLFGPPGCGKTLLAKAVANESHCNFLSVKGPELLNKYVGESERAIRMVFSRAQASSPCVIFFDELDAICPNRSNDAESQSSSRLVNTLLTEMDGMTGRKLVFVIAATNRPDMIDPAMLRPGRLDKALYVDLPNAQERQSILATLTRNTPLHPAVDLKTIANDPKTEGMSGADLASLVREASVNTIRDVFYKKGDRKVLVTEADFQNALANTARSVGDRDRKKYELLKVKFGSR
ncbi:hypothetical protein HDU91_000654 [Kappamyces sp. JEL0680]|nr:hypothetical protein HDU91_000654 [Kappamyces sp. JEL0680]